MKLDLDQTMVAHMVNAVRNATAELHPFPHAIIPNFFPENEYERLIAFLPTDEKYEPFAYEKHQSKDGASNRLRFCMHDSWLDRLQGEQRMFWYAVRKALGSAALKRAVYEKMRVGIAFRFNVAESDVNSIPGYALPELFRELTSYRIKPHPDTRRKVVTMQISLPRDGSHPTLGTEFYSRSLNPVTLVREPRGFQIVKCTPYVPNSAYCFAVLNTLTWKSWHGRSTLPPNCVVRNTILNIWYQNASDANLDLQREGNRVAA